MVQNFKTCLVIEDDHDLRVSLRQVFEAAGFYVFTVTNGFNALELLKIIPAPKLIICDLNMPIMDGASFILAKKELPKIREVPVIVISAQNEKLCEFPDIACLPKPLDVNLLLKTAEDKIAGKPLIPKR